MHLDHPEQALFPRLTGPLDARTKESIYSSYRRGMTVDTLAKTFQRTRTSMYRVINEVRARRLLEVPLDFIGHPDFEKPEREAEFLAPMPGAEEYEAKRHFGHSSIEYAVHVGKEAGTKNLVLFHHCPTHSDDDLDRILQHAQDISARIDGPNVIAAHEGMQIRLDGR